MRYVIIENNMVANIAIAEAPMGPNWIASDVAGIGWVHSNGLLTEPAAAEPVPSSRSLTHLEFRRRFTPQEQELSDELEATFESDPGLSAAQKRKLRTGYKNFNKATAVNLDDPDIPPMLTMYVALGILGAHRPAEILA